eukprot:4309697-Amphidinium_carterae.2
MSCTITLMLHYTGKRMESSWALKRVTKMGEVAEGEACGSCFQNWNRFFKFMTWDQYADSMVQEDCPWPSYLKEAKRLESQSGNRHQCELKKDLGVAKVLKSMTHGIPTIQVAMQGGGTEDMYCFADSGKPYLSCQITMKQGGKMDS